MEIDLNLLVSLLAVQALGGRMVRADNEALKSLKKLNEQAKQKGWLRDEKMPVQVEGKKKPTMVAAWSLTDEGERVLKSMATPEVLQLSQMNLVREQLEQLRRNLDADRAALKQQVTAASKGKGKDKGSPDVTKETAKLHKEVEKIAKAVTALAEQVQGLEARQPKAEDTSALDAKIEDGFAALHSRLDHALQGLTKGPMATPSPKPPPPVMKPEPAVAPPAEPLAGVIRKAYDTLCRFREYQEGMVEIPRLYHEVKRMSPDLSVDEFKSQLLDLELKRVVQLHIRNEVRDAPEADKAIWRNDKLYYYVFWSHS